MLYCPTCFTFSFWEFDAQTPFLLLFLMSVNQIKPFLLAGPIVWLLLMGHDSMDVHHWYSALATWTAVAAITTKFILVSHSGSVSFRALSGWIVVPTHPYTRPRNGLDTLCMCRPSHCILATLCRQINNCKKLMGMMVSSLLSASHICFATMRMWSSYRGSPWCSYSCARCVTGTLRWSLIKCVLPSEETLMYLSMMHGLNSFYSGKVKTTICMYKGLLIVGAPKDNKQCEGDLCLTSHCNQSRVFRWAALKMCTLDSCLFIDALSWNNRHVKPPIIASYNIYWCMGSRSHLWRWTRLVGALTICWIACTSLPDLSHMSLINLNEGCQWIWTTVAICRVLLQPTKISSITRRAQQDTIAREQNICPYIVNAHHERTIKSDKDPEVFSASTQHRL